MSETAIAIPPFRELLSDGTLRFHFHPGQTRAWECERSKVLVLAGSQGGKTEWGVVWMRREVERKGVGDYLVVTATFPLLNLKLLPTFLDLFQYTLKLGRFYESSKVFEFKGGKTRVIFGSATNPESIESATAKAAWLDEVGQKQFRREAYEGTQRRLAIHHGRTLFTTTPYGPGWFKTELYDRAMNGDLDIGLVQFKSVENPAFPRDVYEKARATLPAWKFAMFHEGRYEKPAGLIYDCFDEKVCVIPRFIIPESWPRYVGQDFGSVNMAALWFAQDPVTGYLYAYREYLEGGASVQEHARRFKELSVSERIVKRMGGSHTEEGWRDAFIGAGWPVAEPRIRDVELGINRVYGLFALNKVFVFEDMERFRTELSSYARELDDNNEPTEEIEDKADYHLMDCARYILGDFDQGDEVRRGGGKYRPRMF